MVEIGGHAVDGGIQLYGERHPVEPLQIDIQQGGGGIVRCVGDVEVIDQRAVSVFGDWIAFSDLIKENFPVDLSFDHGQHKVAFCGAACMQHGVLLFDIPYSPGGIGWYGLSTLYKARRHFVKANFPGLVPRP